MENIDADIDVLMHDVFIRMMLLKERAPMCPDCNSEVQLLEVCNNPYWRCTSCKLVFQHEPEGLTDDGR